MSRALLLDSLSLDSDLSRVLRGRLDEAAALLDVQVDCVLSISILWRAKVEKFLFCQVVENIFFPFSLFITKRLTAKQIMLKTT